ncbi:MAG: transcriptional regulator, AraC family [Candidatus Angelobacter sp.]|nr:transcriptional regulator, AraC family [Candidatus Angelobacter sp.]
MDPITDLFQTMQIAGVVHARLEATAPWGLKRDAVVSEGISNGGDSAESATSLFHFAHFGMLSRGNCWLSVEGIPAPIPLAGGDCFLLAPGSAYTLRDNPRTRARSFCEAAPRNGSQVIEYGGGGAPTTIVSGWFRFRGTGVKPLTRLLPPLILVKADQAQSQALHTTLNMLASETAESAPGSELVVNRLADMLFIHCIRAHIGSHSEACKSGLLQAIFDPQIGVALKSMHEKVEHPWTVESLAVAGGMSRSAFAVRFKHMVGETPMEYLTNWRMQKATALLQNGDKKLYEVAKAVGYDSDAAFSKAFKRVFRVAPREYRQNATGHLEGHSRPFVAASFPRVESCASPANRK